MRHGDRLVGEQKQCGKPKHQDGPDQRGLPRRRPQRAEREYHEQPAQEHHAHLRRDIAEGEHDQQADDELRRDEIVVLEALGDARLRQHEVEPDRREPAGRIGGGDRHRNRAGIGVDLQDPGIDQVAGGDHQLDLAALPGATREGEGIRPQTGAWQLGSNRMQERRCRRAHDLSSVGTGAKIYRGKPLGLVSFRTSIGPRST